MPFRRGVTPPPPTPGHTYAPKPYAVSKVYFCFALQREDGQGRRWIRVWCDGLRVLPGRFVTLQRIRSKEEDSRR